MAERLERWTGNSEAPSLSPTLTARWICSPEFKSSTTLINGHLLCLLPVGILNPIVFELNYLFHEFARPH